MTFQVMVRYRDAPVVYNVTQQQDDVYHLRLHGQAANSGDNYVPEKMVIRRKGKIWVSDLEDYPELVGALTAEITLLRTHEDK